MQREAAESLIRKLRGFAQELDDDERELLASLLAPGVARAYADDEEVRGFAMEERIGRPLPDSLVAELRASGMRVVGLDDQ